MNIELQLMSEADHELILNISEEEVKHFSMLRFHQGWGQRIRNGLGLWQRYGDGDDWASTFICENVWMKIHDKPPGYRIRYGGFRLGKNQTTSERKEKNA